MDYDHMINSHKPNSICHKRIQNLSQTQTHSKLVTKHKLAQILLHPKETHNINLKTHKMRQIILKPKYTL